MIRDLLNRAIAVAVAAAAAFVAIVALGATVYYGLSLVVTPLGAAAITAGLFAVTAFVTFFLFAKKAAGESDDDDIEDEEPEGIASIALHLVQQRPVIGIVAALTAGALILKKPGLAALALTAFNESRGNSSQTSAKSRKSSRRRR